MIESLHNHTTTSDGILGYRELLALARECEVGVIAFTDHDALPSEAEYSALPRSERGSVDWVMGIEMTAKTLSGKGTLHIVGLFVDPLNTALRAHCARAQEARRERMVYIVGKLQELGFRVSEEDCLAESGGEAVGRPHILAALKKYPENQKLFDRLFEKMKEAASRDVHIRARFDAMVALGPRQYPYGLVLSPDAFRPAYMEASYLPTIEEASRLIRHAGGMSFLAHYSYDKSKLPIDEVRELLRSDTLDGVEVVYGAGVIGTDRGVEFEQDKTNLRALAASYGRLVSGGADAHVLDDLERFASAKDFSGDSEGMTAKIIATGRVEVRNSSLD